MTEEAHGLATALKGQAKKQGNWGELVLGNVLDRSGLREGKDFKREVSFNTEEGRKRPDVVIYLPQAKHLVIDAKVSLNAYTRYVNAEDDLDRQQALQEHVSAVASRIQELSNRAYFDLPGLNTPEMVFMFIPIESAFVEALRADESLFQKAIEQNVLVATPTTLLTSLNIVRQLWRFEEQNAHTAELADRAGKVYKKLVSFLGSMEAVGKQLDKAKESFGTAMGQLYTGKGNLIGQAKEFEKLGVSVQTPLPEHLVAKAALELEHLPEICRRHSNWKPRNHDHQPTQERYRPPLDGILDRRHHQPAHRYRADFLPAADARLFLQRRRCCEQVAPARRQCRRGAVIAHAAHPVPAELRPRNESARRPARARRRLRLRQKHDRGGDLGVAARHRAGPQRLRIGLPRPVPFVRHHQ
jgi:hypothetical protein